VPTFYSNQNAVQTLNLLKTSCKARVT